MGVTQQQLNGFLGNPIGQVCPNGYANDADNHCAHFVSHALRYQFGVTCLTMSRGRQPGANIRVQEICRLTLRHVDGDDRWGWGVQFHVRKSDGMVFADSFTCTGAG